MSGDEYDRLVGSVGDQMIRSIWRILGDPDDAEDALQDALASVWQHMKRVRSHPNPKALILRICVNAAYDKLRQRRRRMEVGFPLDDPEDPSLSAEEQLIGLERRAEVREAISRLSRKQAEAVLLRDIEDQPYEVVAQALGCRESTARKHVARARERLRKLLSDVPTDLSKQGEQA